jgi:hypothetical protein
LETDAPFLGRDIFSGPKNGRKTKDGIFFKASIFLFLLVLSYSIGDTVSDSL